MTERCVLKLTPDGIAVVEVAPGIDLDRDVLAHAAFPLLVPSTPKLMDAALFRPEPFGLRIPTREDTVTAKRRAA